MIIVYALLTLGALGAVSIAAGLRILKRYERGEQFRATPVIVGLIDRLHRVSLGIITLPILAPETVTRDKVCVDVCAVLQYRRVDAASKNVNAALTAIAQSTTRAVVGRHTIAETLSEPEAVAHGIREILDRQAVKWGVIVTDFTLQDVRLLATTTRRDMGRGAGAGHERRPKVGAAEGDTVARAIGQLPHTNGHARLSFVVPEPPTIGTHP